MIFHDFTCVAGSRTSSRTHDSSKLVRAAVEVFRDMFERHGSAFREPIPVDQFQHIELQWTSEQEGAGLATFWIGKVPLTVSALVSGRAPKDDQAALDQLQALVVRLFTNTGVEPGFDVAGLVERPLIVSLVMPVPPRQAAAMGLVADMETCLAAAYFESLS